MEGLALVRSRIAEIQARFPAAPSPARSASSEWAVAASAAGLSAGTSGAVPPPVAAPSVPAARADLAAAGGTAAETAVVSRAREFLGVPYLWGGTDPGKGLDCSGFVQLVYRSQGIDLPRVSAQQATAGRAVASLTEARPGDLLFFDYSPARPGIDHVGIYLGGGQMVAAPQPGEVVSIQTAGRPTVIRRVLPDENA